MSLIQVFASERDAGLTELIQKNNSVAFVSQLEAPKTEYRYPVPLSALLRTEATNEGQIDLHYLDTILTTVGWNKNDDVFDRYETWNARATAEDKPFNLEHNPRQIIGHIVGSKAVDTDYKVIADDTDVELLPDVFHILASSVIYKHLKSKDEELTEATAAMLEEIKNGDWYVSMEALFNNFNYAIVTASGEQHIIPRTEETAFLTKHLRAYKGSGTYEGNKIGRAMAGLFFSGKGLVRKPANPESIIFASTVLPDIRTFKGTKADLSILKNPIRIGRLNLMNEQELLTKVAQLEARLKAMDEEKVQSKFAQLEAAVASEKEAVAAKDKALADAQAAAVAKDAELATAKEAATKLQVEVKEATEAKQKAETELTAIKAEVTKANRKSDLVGKGVEAAKADELVTKFAALDDEQFGAVAQLAVDAVEAAKKKSDGDNDDEAATKSKMAKGNGLKGAPAQPGSVSAGENTETDPAAGVVTPTEVANATESEEAPLATQASETEANSELMGAIASFLKTNKKPVKATRN